MPSALNLSRSDLLRQALAYAAHGWSVIPVQPRGKKPLIAWVEFQKQRATAEEIRAWWQRWPNVNIGIVTGIISGLVVLDVDGPAGEETLKKQGFDLPPTVCSRTGGGGWHFFFAYPGFECRNFTGKTGETVLPGVDFRGDGGYVLAPPSVHPSGNSYHWGPGLAPEDVALAEPPAWLLALIRAQGSNGDRLDPADWSATVTKGRRNDELARRAGSLLTKMTAEDALPMLLAWSKDRCRPPLAEREVRTIVASIARREAAKPPGLAHLTDLGNAERLISHHGGDLLYCPAWNSWLIWDGSRWLKDETLEIDRRASDTVRHIYGEATAEPGEHSRKALAKHAIKSEAAGRVRAMIERARSLVSVSPADFDKDPYLLNVANGTLDLKTGDLRPHERTDRITKIAPVVYDPDAECPTWLAFLDRIMASNQGLIGFLRRAIGYALTSDTSEQVLFFLHGAGANGKSTFLEAAATMLGDYARQTPSDSLMAKRGASIPNDLAALFGSRFVTAVEAGESRRFAEVLVKQMTGGDRIAARFLHAEFFEFKPTFKVFLAANHKPQIRGTDHAIWRRIRLIPFEVTIPEAEQDKHLLTKLREELPGVLAWAVSGCLEWQQEGLQPPGEVLAATAAYRRDMDVLRHFLEEECVVEGEAMVGSTTLYGAYKEWYAQSGEPAKERLGRRALANRMVELGFNSVKSGTFMWIGLRLRP